MEEFSFNPQILGISVVCPQQSKWYASSVASWADTSLSSLAWWALPVAWLPLPWHSVSLPSLWSIYELNRLQSPSAWAAVAKYQSGWNSRTLFITVLKAQGPRSRCPTDQGCRWELLPGLWTATFPIGALLGACTWRRELCLLLEAH